MVSMFSSVILYVYKFVIVQVSNPALVTKTFPVIFGYGNVLK